MNRLRSLFASAARTDIPKLTNHNDSIYVFCDPLVPPKGVVIFFHDIHWKESGEPHVQSWMSSSEPSVCWPQHWLGAKYPEIQILSARYDACMWKSDTAGHMDLHLVAENLRQDILQIYKLEAESSCPVVLVGHGAGGLVIKKLIQNMQMTCDQLSRSAWASKESNISTNLHRLDCFLKNVKGVFYYATPSLGSQLITSVKDAPHRGNVLAALEALSKDACRLNEWFTTWRSCNHCKATAIFPALPIKVRLWSEHVVEEASARSDVDYFYSSNRDHLNVCKPRDQTDSSWHRLIELLEPHMSTSTHRPTSQVGETHMSTSTYRPTSQVGENVDVECAEIVRNLLDDLAKLDKGKGILVKRDYIRKMERFPKTLSSLRDSLGNAGLEFTYEDSTFQFWEPGFDKDGSDYTREDSP